MEFKGFNNEFVELKELDKDEELSFDQNISFPLMLVWVKGEHTKINYEGIETPIYNDTIICLTKFHKFKFNQLEKARIIKFNKEFYCVLEHDSEVSCKGLLFYGANELPIFQIPPNELEKFEILWKMFQIEMESKDQLQLEMLQMMLKRFIILSTRIYKHQNNIYQLEINEADLIRSFNFLVEQYFKSKHTVKDYAEILNKSPKTIANTFSKQSEKTPLQIIHERKLLEAKRMLRYTDYTVKEIAYELGFEDIQTFSRFFKKNEGMSPSDFKKSLEGTLVNR